MFTGKFGRSPTTGVRPGLNLCYSDDVCEFEAAPFTDLGVEEGLDGRVGLSAGALGGGDQVLCKGAVGLPDFSRNLLEVELDDALGHSDLELEVEPGRFEGLGEGITVALDEPPGEVHDVSKSLLFHTLKILEVMFWIISFIISHAKINENFHIRKGYDKFYLTYLEF